MALRVQIPVGAATKHANAPTVFAVSPAFIELDGTSPAASTRWRASVPELSRHWQAGFIAPLWATGWGACCLKNRQ